MSGHPPTYGKNRVRYEDIRIEGAPETPFVHLAQARVDLRIATKVDNLFYAQGRGKGAEHVERHLRWEMAQRIYGDVQKKIHAAEVLLRDALLRGVRYPDYQAIDEAIYQAFEPLQSYGNDLAQKPRPEPQKVQLLEPQPEEP